MSSIQTSANDLMVGYDGSLYKYPVFMGQEELRVGSLADGISDYPLKADERVKNLHIDDDVISVDLMDGRSISVPLIWYPKLANASRKARENWQTSGGGYGIHWPEIDEDLSTEGMLRGAPAPKPFNH